ncbi:MAG: hypothetical protein M0P36_00250 [Bacteroidales bacterium]|nr:hypothetical protein [Bacteroidales bacterium]
MKICKHIFLGIILLLHVLFCFGQLKPKIKLTVDEQELYSKSYDYFFEEDYLAANQGFSQLVSLYPTEAIFNYYYGACLVKLAIEPKSSLKFLEYSANKGINQANFYIGLSYHFMYEFDKALNYYNIYKKNAKNKDIVNFEVEQYINMANNGKELVKYAYELKLINLKKVSKNNFHYSYNLNDFGGNIIVKTDEFRTKADRKILETDLMYISDKHNVLFFSSYGDSRKNSLDLYISRKINGTWTTAQKLPEIINTEYDEAYPFLTEDGKTLFFSSKGHNSMGGYDIFKTNWDSENNKWSIPVNLDFPINSPFDDIMYALDRFGESAFFTSTRESKANECGVYRILVVNNPERRIMNDINDVYLSANPSVSNLAINELNQRQENRAKLKDTIHEKDVKPQDIKIVEADVDLAIQEMYEKLNEISDEITESKKYAAAANKLSNEKVSEIKKLNSEISKLKNENKQTNELKIRDLQSQINSLTNQAIQLNDIAKYFYDFSLRTEGLMNYYLTELKVLDKTPRSEKSLEKSVNLTQAEINKIDLTFPLLKYIDDLNKEADSENNKIEKFNNLNKPLFSEIEKLNSLIFGKIEITKQETEFELREKYIYDIKTYENQKIDIIDKIKENQIQIEFSKIDIVEINTKIEETKVLTEEIENNLFLDRNLNLTKSNNDIETLKAHKTQTNLKDLAEVQNEIKNDLSLYSPIVDYDAILYGEELVDIENEIFIDIENYKSNYSNFISEETKIFGETLVEIDSLKNQIALFEAKFDNSESYDEKQNLINNINRTQIKINENKNILRENSKNFKSLNSKNNNDKFVGIRAKDEDDKFNDKSNEIQNLINISNKLENDISDFAVLFNNRESLDLWFLELIKNDIDKDVENKILELENLINSEIPEIQDIFAELKPKLSNNQNRIKQSKQIIDEFEKAKTLFVVSENSDNNQEKNRLISQANEIIEENLQNSIAYLNKSIQEFYSDYFLYTKNIQKFNLNDNRTKTYFQKAENFKLIADSLQIIAEETNSQKEIISLLGEAYKNIEISVLNMNYIFEFLNDKTKYVPNKNFGNRQETLNFVNEINAINTKELVIEEIELIVELSPKNIDNLILNSEKINDEINVLTAKFTDSDNDDKAKILLEIEKLNQNLKSQLNEINEEIINLQQKSVNEQLEEIVSNKPNEDISVLEKEIKEYNEEIYAYYDNKDYFLLNEVIIAGEKILAKQNNLLKNKKVIIIPQAQINNLIAYSKDFESFVNRENKILENEKLIAEQNLAQNQTNEDDILEVSEKQNENIEEKLEIQDLDFENEDLIADNQEDESENKNLESPDISYNDIEETVENTEKIYNLNEFEQFLNFNNEDLAFSNKNTKINKTQNEIIENQEKISDLNNKIEQNSSKKQAKKLNLEKTRLENQQNKILIEQSETRLNFIKEINDIYKSINPELVNNSEYQKLIENYEDARNSIISYSNFYSNEEILNIYEKANETENLIISEIMKNSNPEDFAVLFKPESSEIEDKDIQIISKIDYKHDKEDEKTLNSLETKLSKLESKIKYNENQIKEYEKLISESSNYSVYKKDKKAVEKLEKQQVKLINDYVKNAKDYAILEYSIRTKFFDENLGSEDEIIKNVSDSLKTKSENDFQDLISNYYKLLNYDSKTNNKTIIEEFEKTEKLSILSFKNIELANEVLSFQDKNSEILTPYYKQVELEDIAEFIENETSETDLEDEMLIPEKEIIAENIEEDKLEIDETQKLESSNLDFYYRIQFAAYNNMLDENNFPSLLPLFTENIENSRLIRFMTGTYYQFTIAQENLPKVKNSGFADAFIVAYYKGKRINIAEARRIEQEIQIQRQEDLLANKEKVVEIEFDADENIITQKPEVENEEISPKLELDLTKTREVFYCVQVGVYRERIAPERLYNLEPLFYDEYSPNLIRHTFGKYYDLNTAIQDQNRIRQMGITDAFVIAYANGKKINLYEARNLLSGQVLNEELKQEIIVVRQEDRELRQEEEKRIDETHKIEYFIQIGAFKKDINSFIRDVFEKLAGNKKLYQHNYNNLHIYRIGVFSKFNEAQTQLSIVKAGGIPDAFIIAYNNGKRIDLQTARRLE